MRTPRAAAAFRGAGREFALAFVAGVLTVSLTMFSVPYSAALFTSDYPAVAIMSSGQIFPGVRDSSAFDVSDHSGGSQLDVSSPVAFAGDGRLFTTSSWPASFAGDRYVEFRFNSPLPGNVPLSAASFDLSWATASGTACMYFELRDASDALLDTEGDAGSPLACTSTAALGDVLTPLPTVSSTDQANGASVRMFVTSSDSAGTVLDRATLTVTYDAEQFRLFATDLTDLSDGSPWIEHWGLAGP